MSPDNVGKRICDNDKYKVAPCPNAGVPLDEYWDTQLLGGGWANLCHQCTVRFGYISSKITTHMVWNEEVGCYEKAGK